MFPLCWARALLVSCAFLCSLAGMASSAQKQKKNLKKPIGSDAIPLVTLQKMGYALLSSDDLFLSASMVRSLSSGAKIHQADLESAVNQTYTFVGDFFVTEKDPLPRYWAQGFTLPERLALGQARTFVRTRPTWLPAVFVWKNFHLLKGNQKVIQLTNAALQHWKNGHQESALKSFAALEPFLDALGPQDPVRWAVHSVRAGYYLFRYLKEGRSEDYEQIRQDLMKAYLNHDIYALTRNYATGIRPSLFTQNGSQGFLVQSQHGKPPRSFLNSGQEQRTGAGDYEVNISNEHMSPQDWWASQALLGLWNLSIMHRTTGLYEKAFLAVDRLVTAASFLKSRYGTLPKSSYFVVSDSPSPELSRVFSFFPLNLSDLIASSHFINLLSYLQDTDPQPILAQASRVIMGAQSNWLKALAFSIVGDTYYDLNVLDWAKRSYSWAEVFGKDDLLQEAPGPYLFAAESLFWKGQWESAARAYSRFLDLAGDKQANPWARLRLAEIAHVQKNIPLARSRYEEIMRLHPLHVTHLVAQVRAYCLDGMSLPVSALEPQARVIRDLLPQLDSALSEQAKACLLRTQINEWRRMAPLEKADAAQDRAQEQQKALKEFHEAFPDSVYFPLFKEWEEQVSLGDIPGLFKNPQCKKLLGSVEKNLQQLRELPKTSGAIPGLAWGNEELNVTLRCAYLERQIQFHERLKEDLKSSDVQLSEIQTLFFEFSRQSHVKSAQKLKRALLSEGALKRSPRDLDAAILHDPKELMSEDFWERLANIRLAEWELTQLTPQKKKSSDSKIQKMAQALGTETNCLLLLRDVSSYGAKDWDMLAEAVPNARWFAWLDDGAAPKGADACARRVAQKLLDASLHGASVQRDRTFLLPYLKKQGYKKSSDLWLMYAQRKQKNGRRVSGEVRGIYEALAKESSDPIVQKTAQLWMENHDKK